MAQIRVIHAIALRETRTRFGQNRLGYVWALVEPLLLIGMFWGIYAMVGRRVPDGMDVVPFLATGILAYQFFAKTMGQTAAAVSGNKALLYYPQVQTLDLIAARAGLEAATYGLAFVLIVGTYSFVEGSWQVDSLLRTAFGLGLASGLGMTLGLLCCAAGVVSNTVDRIRGPLMRPLFWTSGLFYTANELPSQARELLMYNPVFHCIEITRDGWFPSYHAYYADAAYPLAWIVGLAFVGLTLERAVRRRVQLS